MSRTTFHILALVFIACVVFFTNLGGPRLWDRDEPRNAGCAAEMMERGNWVTPWFNDQVRDHKPVLLYWFMMTAYAVMGVSEFSARFWSAALGVSTVLLTYAIGCRLFNPRAALWGGIALATSLMFGVASRAATPDAPLIFFATAAMAVYVFGTFRRKQSPLDPPMLRVEGRYYPGSLCVILAMYALMGVAVLDKGPIGVVLPTAVIGMFLLIVRLPKKEEMPGAQSGVNWNRIGIAALTVLAVLAVEFLPIGTLKRLALTAVIVVGGFALARRMDLLRPFAPMHFARTVWFMRPVTAALAVCAVALPWYVWVTVISPEWTRGFFLTHNLERGVNAMEGHGGSMLYYPVAVLLGFFPWSLFLGPMLIEIVTRVRRHDAWKFAYIFLACWVCVYIGVFSLAATKLPSYITPMYPALALLAGAFVDRLIAGETAVSRYWLRICFGGLAVVGVGFVIGAGIAASIFLPGDAWLSLVGLVPLCVGVAALLLFERKHVLASMRLFGAGAIVLTTLLFAFVAWRVDRHQKADILVDAIQQRSESPTIRSFGAHEPSWVFYVGHPVRRLPHDVDELINFFYGADDSNDLFVITSMRHFEKNQKRLPDDVRILARAPYFLRNGELVVIGRERGEAVELPTRTASGTAQTNRQ